MLTLISFMSWSPRSSSSQTCAPLMLPAASRTSVASTSDLTVVASGTPSSSATSAQVALPGVGVFSSALAGAGRGPAGACASAFSMLAA
ncbi:hypothetical protein D9M69_602650 [compost metagenome]